MKITWILSVMVALASAVEKCNRPPESGSTCTYLVFAKDYKGLDGCGMLLVQADGSRLLPTNLEEFAPGIKDGAAATIGFETLEDMASICMAEKSIVRLTCFNALQQRSTCPEMIDPYRLEWSETVMQEMDPIRVESLVIADIPAFRFTSGTEVRIYSCHGSLLCSYMHPDQAKCAEVLDRVRDARIIYIVNE